MSLHDALLLIGLLVLALGWAATIAALEAHCGWPAWIGWALCIVPAFLVGWLLL